MQRTLVSVRYCVKGWQISTNYWCYCQLFSWDSLGNLAVPVVMKMKKGVFTSEENPKLYKYLERGKVLYAINDVNLPFPVTFTQITWFVLTEFIIILFADLPPLSMIEGAFLKYFGIPVALTWFMSQKTFDGKKPYSYIKTMVLYALRPKVTYAGKAVNLHKQKFEETITAVRSVTYVPN